MAFKVQVGPAQIAIHQGRTVLVCEPDGTIPFPSEKGLYFNDTRIISSWSLYADGVRWDLLSGGATSHDRSSVHLTNRKLVTASGPVAARTLGLVLTRSIAGGVHEDIDIANHGAAPVRFNLNQMPELYAGLPRTPSGFPVQYVGANVPQAWAAGSVFMTLRAMLGLSPDAPNGRLWIDPALPAWLPDLMLIGLRLGRDSFDIRFWREDNGTAYAVLRGDPAAVVRGRPGSIALC